MNKSTIASVKSFEQTGDKSRSIIEDNHHDKTVEITEVDEIEENPLSQSNQSGDFVYINEKKFMIDGDEVKR